MNVAGLLLRSAEQHGAHTAVQFASISLEYEALADRARRLAAGLHRLGLVPGDRVALLLPNGPEIVESLFGIWIAGMTVVPVNARAHAAEAAFIVGQSGARAIIHDGELAAGLDLELSAQASGARRIGLRPEHDAEHLGDLLAGERLEQAVERRADDVAWLFYTSGTTGKPKGAMLTHRNLRQMVLSHLADVRSFRPQERVLHAAPLTHGAGMVLLACIARGTTNVIYHHRSFRPDDVLGVIGDDAIESISFLAPTQIAMLNEAAPHVTDGLALRSVCYGGAPMFGADLRTAMDTFGPVFVQIYGQGEAPMTIAALGEDEHARFAATDDPRLLSAGRPRTDVEIRVVDDEGVTLPAGEQGEILVRGDVVMHGYWQDPAATADTLRDGWLHTGDVGLVDDAGYLFLLDRSKDLIISGGNNIYPREVEEAILALPEVRAVAVIGLPDARWGESVHAVVVLEPGCSLDPDAVVAACRARLAGYKKPKSVEFVDELPVNAYGKILKRDLRSAHDARRRDAVG